MSPLAPRALTPDEVRALPRDEVGEQGLEYMRTDGLDLTDPEAYCRAQNELFIRARVPTQAVRARVEVPCDQPNEWAANVERVFGLIGGSLGPWDWRDEARSVDSSALVIVGSEELRISSEEWVKALPNAKLVVIPDAGHFPWVEDPDSFFAAVNTFAAR